MTAFYLGPLGRLRPLDLVQRGASAQVSRASSSFVTLGGRRFIQRAPAGPRDWSLSLGARRDASQVAHVAACATGALPGPLYLYAGDAARTNLLAADVAAPGRVGSTALGSVLGSVAVGMPPGVESLTGVVQQASAGAWSRTVPLRQSTGYVLSGWSSAAGAAVEWRTISTGGVPVSSGTLSTAAVEGGFYGAVEVPSGTAAGVQVRLAAGSRTVGGLRLVEGVLPESGPVVRRNLFPNPSFETGFEGVIVQSSALTLTTTDFAPAVRAGTHAMAATVTGTPHAFSYIGQNATASEGQWIAAKIPARASGSAQRTSLFIQFFNGGTAISGVRTDRLTALPEVWVTPTVVAQAPAGTTSARVYIYMHSPTTDEPLAGATMHTDAWIACAADSEAEALAQVQTYFDGSTPPTPGRYTAWDGTPHASPSTEYVLPDGATLPGWAPGRGVPQVVVDDPAETLQLVTSREVLADYTVTIREVG